MKTKNQENQGLEKVSEIIEKKKKTKVSLTKEGLTPKQELFCKFYTGLDRELFGNGTQSYIEAYGYRDEEGDRVISYNSIMACASRLLSNAKVCDRINQLLEQGGFNDENVDKQHLFLINQHVDFKTKLGAIKEYNLVKKRVQAGIQVNVFTPTEEDKQKAQEAVNKFLQPNDNPRNSTIGD